ncbi:MAG: DUF2948 family protein [Alphaproteobacteria bacterium]|nr:DUF2948 family protein [Alphaproteobacteria bacterium]
MSSHDRGAKPESANPAADGALRLMAFDSADLEVISAHVQDALVRVAGMTYRARERRFVLMASRFDWLSVQSGAPQRSECGLHFDHVEAVAFQGFDRSDGQRVLNLLSINFHPGDAPSGEVVLTFSAEAAIRLKVECLDAQLNDLGLRWKTRRKPGHGTEYGE